MPEVANLRLGERAPKENLFWIVVTASGLSLCLPCGPSHILHTVARLLKTQISFINTSVPCRNPQEFKTRADHEDHHNLGTQDFMFTPQGAQVRSLVKELRYHMAQKNKREKKKQTTVSSLLSPTPYLLSLPAPSPTIPIQWNSLTCPACVMFSFLSSLSTRTSLYSPCLYLPPQHALFLCVVPPPVSPVFL